MSSSPSSADKNDRDTSEATNNLISGKRFLLVNDYVSAVESLQEACHLFAKHYGDTAIECAEPYLYYGKALLELSRMETGVLGNALEGVSPEEDDDDDDEEEDDDQVENPDKVTEEEENATEESESTGEKSQDEDVAQDDDDEAGPSTSTGVSKTEKEEEVSNLQLAWEMLELSKVIFTRQSEIDGGKELKVAEVLLKLGEVSIESENYEQAVEDLTACFNIQKKHLASYDRALAETLYQLGLATSFSNQFERAIESFTNSMKVLEERIAVLKQSLEDQEKSSKTSAANTADVNGKTAQKDAPKSDDNQSKVEKCAEGSNTSSEDAKKENAPSSEDTKKEDIKKEKAPSSEDVKKENAPSSEDAKKEDTKKEDAPSSGDAKNENSSASEDSVEDPLLSIKQEIEELEELIPDIRTKIEDTEDMMKNAVQSVEEALTEISQIPVKKSPCKVEEKAKPISNISHLVKRKRKPEEDCSSADTSNDLKKPRPSEEIEEIHVNGEMVVNGDSKPMETEESVKLKTKESAETQPEVKKAVA